MTADDIINAVRDLPSLPAVVCELLACIDQDDLDTNTLAAKITLDQALTAKTLRLANSSFYGLPTRVNTIQQAISILGVHAVRTLVTTCSVTDSFRPSPGNQSEFEAFWRHSIATAVCARLLASQLGLNPDTAFTAGLLHDLGTLVMLTCFPADYVRVRDYRRQHDCSIAQAELAEFGTDHAAVGSELAKHWKFPIPIQLAVANHHRAVVGAPVTLSLVIYIANILAHALDLSGQEDDQVAPLSLAVWQSLGLTDTAWTEVFAETERQFESMCQMLTS